jgi:phosphoribosylanthranilate isomerase
MLTRGGEASSGGIAKRMRESYDSPVHRTRIKICGVRREEDAVIACSLGADAIGMVLHRQARRAVSVDQARKILAAISPFVTPVALFVDREAQDVLDTAAALNIRCVQLHGDESPDDVAELKGLTVLKSIHVDADLPEKLERWRSAMAENDLAHVAGIVLDTASAEKGGSGIANDWELIARLRVAGEFNGLPPIIAAGGLTPESVGAVIRAIRPIAVDVSSGVESAIGEKSEARIQSFVRAVRDADASAL